MFNSILRAVSATLLFTVALFGVMCYLNVTMMEQRRLSTVRDPEVLSKLH